MNVLIHARDAALRAELSSAVRLLGYEPIEATRPVELRSHAPLARVVLIDVTDPDAGELVEQVGHAQPDAGIVVLGDARATTAAIPALRDGAHAYLRKPFSVDSLETALEDAGSRSTCDARSAGFIARHPETRRARSVLARAAVSDATVLIRGAAGTGKSHAARWLHEVGRRRRAPFVAIDCLTLAAHSSEDDPFGTELEHQNAFGRVESAEGGTCVLENVDALHTSLQPRLVELMQTRRLRSTGGRAGAEIDVRFVATTRRDLDELAERGEFLKDLQYQLDVIDVFLPPLAERTSDIAPLADLFLDRHAAIEGRERPSLDGEALRALAAQPLTGNVRELAMLMRRAVLLSDGDRIDLAELRQLDSERAPRAVGGSETFDLKVLERDTIARALVASGGNRTAAARTLGISVRTLRNKIHRYEL